MRRKRKKKVPRYIKMGKVKLSQEEWETRTALTDYFKPGKMEVVLKEAKPKEEEVKLVPAKEEIKLVEARKPMEVKLVEMKSPDEPEREPVNQL